MKRLWEDVSGTERERERERGKGKGREKKRERRKGCESVNTNLTYPWATHIADVEQSQLSQTSRDLPKFGTWDICTNVERSYPEPLDKQVGLLFHVSKRNELVNTDSFTGDPQYAQYFKSITAKV